MRRAKGCYEEDAFSGWRRVLHWRPGERKLIKRKASRRERREVKQELKNGMNDE